MFSTCTVLLKWKFYWPLVMKVDYLAASEGRGYVPCCWHQWSNINFLFQSLFQLVSECLFLDSPTVKQHFRFVQFYTISA